MESTDHHHHHHHQSRNHHHHQTSNAIGFFLLPSELIQYIILHLALPDIVRLKSVNKSISHIISDQYFVRDYNHFHSVSSTNWLFIYKKRWRRDALLHGYYTDSYSDSNRCWFNFLIADILKPLVPPGEDLYLLAASGNFFLFALNNSREVVSVNPINRTVKRIPPSPLGPRGTSSWRRSGLKLLSSHHLGSSDNFRFLFAEIHGENNVPVLFQYDSTTEEWQSIEAVENGSGNGGEQINTDNSAATGTIFLSAFNGRNGSVIVAKQLHRETPPLILRPTFIAAAADDDDDDDRGLNRENVIDRLHVYGDGKVMIIKSKVVVEEGEERKRRVKMLKSVELWGLNKNGGRNWELMSKVPNSLVEKIKKPYGAMMGCLELEERIGIGVVRAVLMSNLEGSWDIIWLTYNIQTKVWTWLPIPDCKMKGANMAGIAFSSGLSLLGC